MQLRGSNRDATRSFGHSTTLMEGSDRPLLINWRRMIPQWLPACDNDQVQRPTTAARRFRTLAVSGPDAACMQCPPRAPNNGSMHHHHRQPATRYVYGQLYVDTSLSRGPGLCLHHPGGCVIDPLTIGRMSLIVDKQRMGRRSCQRLSVTCSESALQKSDRLILRGGTRCLTGLSLIHCHSSRMGKAETRLGSICRLGGVQKPMPCQCEKVETVWLVQHVISARNKAKVSMAFVRRDRTGRPLVIS